MAVVVPLIASFGAVSAGVGALAAATTALGTFAAYATIAGGVLTGIGAVTGKKDLMKVGGILALGGGLTTAFSGSGSAAGSAAAEKVGETTAGTVAENTGGLGELVDATGGIETANPAFSLADKARGVTGAVATDPTLAAAQVPGVPTEVTTPGVPPELNPLDQRLAAGTATTPIPASVAEAAKGLTMNDLSTWWEKAKAAGEWASKNPALLKIGGDILGGMQQADQLDYQRSLLERARANLNAPIRLQYKAP